MREKIESMRVPSLVDFRCHREGKGNLLVIQRKVRGLHWNWAWVKSSRDSCCCSVTESCLTLCDARTTVCQAPSPPPSPAVCSNSCQLNRWCYLTISSSVASFFFCLQSFPASGAFAVSWLFTSHGQSTGASASASVLPINIHGWFPLGLIGLISLQSKGLSRVFSNTTVQKHQFFGSQLSL